MLLQSQARAVQLAVDISELGRSTFSTISSLVAEGQANGLTVGTRVAAFTGVTGSRNDTKRKDGKRKRETETEIR